jgi:small subunit ribosomal protein S19
MVRVTRYRGKTEEELKKMTLEDSMPLLTSRARRSLKRAMVDNKNQRLKKFMKKVQKIMETDPQKTIRTHERTAVILPSWVGLTFGVHNGKEFKKVVITVDRIGYRLGDFAHSTSRVLHSGPGVGATRGSKFVPLK